MSHSHIQHRSHKHKVEQKKSNTKEYILDSFIYLKFKKQTKLNYSVCLSSKSIKKQESKYHEIRIMTILRGKAREMITRGVSEVLAILFLDLVSRYTAVLLRSFYC